MSLLKQRFRLESVLLAILIGTTLVSVGCTEKGPAEKAGENIDEAVEKLQHGDEGTLEKAGRKMDETIEEAKN